MLFIWITANKKLNRKDMKMNTKNSIVTYALVGLAAGTAAWLLLGTKEGRKQMDRASDGIRELSKSIRKTTKEGIRRASDIANRATEEIDPTLNEQTAETRDAKPDARGRPGGDTHDPRPNKKKNKDNEKKKKKTDAGRPPQPGGGFLVGRKQE